MTAEEFSQTVVQFPRLSEKAKNIARAILVDGKSLEEVCIEFDVSRQLAHQWATKVYMGFAPKGWVSEVVTLPEIYMQRIRKLAEELGARARREHEEARVAPIRAMRR